MKPTIIRTNSAGPVELELMRVHSLNAPKVPKYRINGYFCVEVPFVEDCVSLKISSKTVATNKVCRCNGNACFLALVKYPSCTLTPNEYPFLLDVQEV